MSVSAIHSENWYLEGFDPTIEYQTATPSSGGDPVLQSREHYVITQSRKLVKVTGFDEEVGTSKTSFQWYMGGSVSLFKSSTGTKYICSSDKLQIVNLITGEAKQTQVWEHYTEWEDVDMDDFT